MSVTVDLPSTFVVQSNCNIPGQNSLYSSHIYRLFSDMWDQWFFHLWKHIQKFCILNSTNRLQFFLSNLFPANVNSSSSEISTRARSWELRNITQQCHLKVVVVLCVLTLQGVAARRRACPDSLARSPRVVGVLWALSYSVSTRLISWRSVWAVWWL